MNGNFIGRVQKLTMIMLLVSIIALLFMPLLPWSFYESDTSWGSIKYYSTEGNIMVGGERAEDEIDNYNKGSDSYELLKETISAKDNLSGIGLCFWLSLIFTIILLVGIKIYNMGQQYQLFSNIIFLTGIMIIIFAIFIILYHVWFMGNIGELADIGNIDVAFSFNYLPLTMGIILLIVSIIYVFSVVPMAIYGISSSLQHRMMGHQVGMPPQQPPQQTPQPTGHGYCLACGGAKLSDTQKFCHKCGKKLV
ncbi:MAG: zinc ribbon domain-containing protein [Thermoplasmatales archaeon]|nr:zinc ribbon domain-containing protein [Thermoplasmatales archaeon]